MLLERLADPRTPPSERAVRDEQRVRVRVVLGCLAVRDREILELHYLKALSFAEIAAELAIGLSAVKMRHLRALERFCGLLAEHGGGSEG
jgi:RNA polymerase sigma factor (sigma-70 family)